MKKKILSILLMFTIIVVSAIPTMGLNVCAANGVQTKINELLAVYPNGSYFTSTGNAFSYYDCVFESTACPDSMLAIPSRGGLPSGQSICNMIGGNYGHSCYGFATYCFGYIFGQNWRNANIVTAPSLGDLIHITWSYGNHYFIYISEDSSYYYVYDSNGDSATTNKVLYNHKIAKSAIHSKTIYHATNYNSVNGSSGSPSTSYENISPGTYAIKNNNTGTYMCVSYGIDNNTQNVDLYSEINVASRMVISKASTGYKIRPECCASRIINPYGYTVTSGLNVNIYNDENDSSQWWQFQKVSGGYVIRNVQNTSCVLDTDGSNVYVSTYSGASTQIWSLVSTHVHSYGSWKVRKAATCTSGGTEYRTCSCGAEETRTTSALGHNYTSVITNPTCTSGGYTTYTCSRCYNSYTGNNTSAKGHSYGSWKVRKAATCTSGGTEYRTCSCGAEETRTTLALGHNYTSVITNPTCTSGGYTTYTCSRCYNSYTENNTSAKGHSYSSWKVRKAATCTANGTEYRTCSCGAEETRTTSSLGHNYTSVITNPTCTSGGYTTYTCSRCYNSYTGNNTSAKGHTAGDWVVVKEADFGVAGLKIQSCETCGTVLKRQTIPALTYALGDANMDGDVNYLDYIVVKRQCMGTYKITDEALIYADVDGSGKVDYMDYIMIKRHCMGTYVIK